MIFRATHYDGDREGRKWNEQIQNGQGAVAAMDIITPLARNNSKGDYAPAGTPVTVRSGRNSSRRLKARTIRAVSPRYWLRMDLGYRRK